MLNNKPLTHLFQDINKLWGSGQPVLHTKFRQLRLTLILSVPSPFAHMELGAVERPLLAYRGVDLG